MSDSSPTKNRRAAILGPERPLQVARRSGHRGGFSACRDNGENFCRRPTRGGWRPRPGGIIADAIAAYEGSRKPSARSSSYSQLLFAGDSTDPAIGRFYQSVRERVTAISSDLIFFTLELNRMSDAVLESKLADPKLARYQPWLRDLRVYPPASAVGRSGEAGA